MGRSLETAEMVEMLRSLERGKMEVFFNALCSPGDGKGGGSPRGGRGIGWPENLVSKNI